MKQYLFMACASACLCSNAALAVENFYAGANIGSIEYQEPAFVKGTASISSVIGRFGAQFSEHLSAEARLGFGISEGSLDPGVKVDVELDSLIGAYLRAGFRPNNYLYPYATVGFTQIELTATVPGYDDSATESESGITLGLGLDINLGSTFTINLEYMNYFSESESDSGESSGAEIDGLSIGLTGRF